jgi:hypothetical protein
LNRVTTSRHDDVDGSAQSWIYVFTTSAKLTLDYIFIAEQKLKQWNRSKLQAVSIPLVIAISRTLISMVEAEVFRDLQDL